MTWRITERQIPTARRAGIQLCVAVVDIVHGSHHDISRGGATFWYPRFLGGRVGAFGAAPPCETWSSQGELNTFKPSHCRQKNSTTESAQFHSGQPSSHGGELSSRLRSTGKSTPHMSSSLTLSVLPHLFFSAALEPGLSIQVSYPSTTRWVPLPFGDVGKSRGLHNRFTA